MHALIETLWCLHSNRLLADLTTSVRKYQNMVYYFSVRNIVFILAWIWKSFKSQNGVNMLWFETVNHVTKPRPPRRRSCAIIIELSRDFRKEPNAAEETRRKKPRMLLNVAAPFQHGCCMCCAQFLSDWSLTRLSTT